MNRKREIVKSANSVSFYKGFVASRKSPADPADPRLANENEVRPGRRSDPKFPAPRSRMTVGCHANSLKLWPHEFGPHKFSS